MCFMAWRIPPAMRQHNSRKEGIYYAICVTAKSRAPLSSGRLPAAGAAAEAL